MVLLVGLRLFWVARVVAEFWLILWGLLVLVRFVVCWVWGLL